MGCVNRTCEIFAKILGAEPSITNNTCLATRFRDLKVSILNRRTTSPLVVPQFFSFENMDQRGNTLNLGETVILQEEINPFIDKLREGNIIVTAVHNHWLFDEPRLFYIHFESVEPPLRFAEKVARALQVLKK